MKNIFRIIFASFFLSTSASSYANEKLTVLLDWFINPDHAPLFVAKEKGFFREVGLDVELLGPADPADPPKLVAAGKADIAVTYQPEFLEEINQGLPLLFVGTLIDKPLNCLVVLENGPIKSIPDLKGKKIGYSGSSMADATIKIMLQKYKLSLADVTLLNIHYGLTQALLSGKVDAVTGMMRNFEVTQMELAGKSARLFYPEKEGLPNYSELIFIVQKSHANDIRILHFLAALKRGVAYLKQHPNEMWNVFSKSYPEINNELNKRAWFATLPYFANNPAKIDVQGFMRFAEFMQKNKLINKIQPINLYIR